MEYYNDNQEQEPKVQETDEQHNYYASGEVYSANKEEKASKGGRVGGYILTGMLCLLLGIALGSCSTALVVSGVKEAAEAGSEAFKEEFGGQSFGEMLEDIGEAFGGSFSFDNGDFSMEFHSGEEEETKPAEDEYQEPEKQEYTQRELPAFDGVRPVINDAVNPIPDIVEQVFDGVVAINAYYKEDYAIYGEDTAGGYGSGFVASSEGYIITNAHVIAGADKVTVTFSDGEEVPCEVVGADNTMDVAVLKVEKNGLIPLAIGNSDTVRVGEYSIAIGNPSGSELAGTATFGIVSATSRSMNIDGQVNDYIQTDAAINPGNSGGPLLNTKGEFIGITTAKNIYAGYDEYGNAISAEGLGFAIPANSAMEVVKELITEGHVQRPGMGINVIGISERDAEYYEVVEGILIYSVTKNGPAHKAGLKVDDIVIGYDGQDATTQDAFVEYVKTLGVGDEITLDVWRAGETLKITIVIGDMNEMGSELVGNRVSSLFD